MGFVKLALSHNGALAFGVTGDFEAARDVDLLAAASLPEIVELRPSV